MGEPLMVLEPLMLDTNGGLQPENPAEEVICITGGEETLIMLGLGGDATAVQPLAAVKMSEGKKLFALV